MSQAAWWVHLRGDPSAFLLDDEEPGVVWRALLELLGRPEDSPAVLRARRAARERGTAAAILSRQDPLGFWGSPISYGARWGGTAWQLMAAASLGADPEDPRMMRGAEVLLEAVQPTSGGFATGRGRPPAACFTAELCAALARLGYAHHPRVREAVAWLAARQEGRGGWTCPELRHLVDGGCPVAAVAVLRLVADHPAREQAQVAPLAARAAGWLVDRSLLTAAAPRSWLRFSHPNLGQTDLLDALYSLARVHWLPGEWARSPLETVGAKQDDLGRWTQEQRVATGEPPGSASRWTTLKALTALSAYGSILQGG